LEQREVRLNLRGDQQLLSIGIYVALRLREVRVQAIPAADSSIWVFRTDRNAGGLRGRWLLGQGKTLLKVPRLPVRQFLPIELLNQLVTLCFDGIVVNIR